MTVNDREYYVLALRSGGWWGGALTDDWGCAVSYALEFFQRSDVQDVRIDDKTGNVLFQASIDYVSREALDWRAEGF
jgi:hypothetical protein